MSKNLITIFKYYFYNFMFKIMFGDLKIKYENKMKKYLKYVDKKSFYINEQGINNLYNSKVIIENNIFVNILGNNNKIIFGDNAIINGNLKINIYGNDNLIKIGDNFVLHDSLELYLAYPGKKTNNSRIVIGNNNSIGSCEIILLENNSYFETGANCMFSENIIARLSDTHSVIDSNNNLINYGGAVSIGDHVWIGREVRILKKVMIPDGSIVGASSVVTKCFKDTNIAIAGNPAKIIKNNISWNNLSPDEYISSHTLKGGS